MNAKSIPHKSRLFILGQIVSTPAVLEHFQQYQVNPWLYLERHVTGDFGDLNEEDKAENRVSIQEGFRILSSYLIAGEKVWIITEADRSVTTFLFPSESPRELRRLHFLREWSHEQDEQILPRSQRACRTAGAGST